MSIDLDQRSCRCLCFWRPWRGYRFALSQFGQSFGAGLVVSEMIASQEMVEAKYSVRDKAELGWVLKTPRFKLRAVIPIGCQRPQD